MARKWGIDEFLPRNHGELYGIMMFYGDLHMKRFDWIYESSSCVFRADWKQNKWKSNHEKPAELVMISSFWANSTSLAMENGVFGPPIDGHEMMANVRLQTIGFWGMPNVLDKQKKKDHSKRHWPQRPWALLPQPSPQSCGMRVGVGPQPRHGRLSWLVVTGMGSTTLGAKGATSEIPSF